MAYEPTEHHPAFEEYSEAIFELAEDGVPVIQARISDRLDISRQAVGEMIRRMERENLVETADGGEIALTTEGEDLAKTIVRRHRLAECFLTDVLGLNWTDAHSEAGRWEHVISPLVEAAMLKALGDPQTCPHGNPIPGSGYEEPHGAVVLSEIDAGDPFTVVRIPEELEWEPGQLEFLERTGMMPGQSGVVLSFASDGTATVKVGDNPFGVGGPTAQRIVVNPGT